MPCNTTHTSFLCLFASTSTHYVSLHISQKARQSLQSEVQRAIVGPPRELPCLDWEPLAVPWGLKGPQPLTLSSLTLTRHSSTNTYEDRVGGRSLCAHMRERQRPRPRGRHQKRETEQTEKKRETLANEQKAPSFKP